jgi:peroxiredoxin
MPTSFVLACSLLLGGHMLGAPANCVAGQEPSDRGEAVSQVGKEMPDFTLTGTDGKTYTLSEVKAEKGVLLLFIATKCPVSRAYDNRMNVLALEMKEKGIVVLGINSNETETMEEVTRHAKGMKFTVLKDHGSEVADLYKASVTPEAYLLSPSRVLVYHGRIDDSQAVAQITKQDLRDAILAWLAGKPIPKSETRPFGCTIKRPK